MNSYNSNSDSETSENNYNCCIRNCSKLFTSAEINLIKRNFKKFGYESQHTFIAASVLKREGKRNGYTLLGRAICHKFFKNTLSVGKNKIQNALEKWNKSEFGDKRGKHGNHYTVCEIDKEDVINHIRSFPTYVSHYKREVSSALYLESHLNMALMYRLFLEKWDEKYDDKGWNAPSLSYYKEIFKALGLKISSLKTDTCKTCDQFNMKIKICNNEETLEQLKQDQNKHWEKAEEIRKMMKTDIEKSKTDKTIQVCVYDLQKTLILPKAPTNQLYYLRNFNIFNLNIHENDKGNFHIWSEIDAGRGSQEIASCLIHFLESNLKDETETLILWSDSCGGQNRNHISCMILAQFLYSHSTLKSITLRFLLSGHSYNVCDSDFGVVEKSIRSRETIYTLSEYLDIMAGCKKDNPFIVTQMKRENFFSAANILKNVTKRDADSVTKQKVHWLKTHEIILKKEHQFKLFMKYDINKDDFYTLDYAKKTRKNEITSLNWDEIENVTLFPDGKPISNEKKKDLESLKPLLPEYAQQFIDKVLDCESLDFNDDVDGFTESDFIEDDY